MARIRSIHPGLWTDEAFVSLTPYSRLLFMGIWTECDDMGSFEWSPLKLKMRLLPADNIDAGELLAELEAAARPSAAPPWLPRSAARRHDSAAGGRASLLATPPPVRSREVG